MSNSQTNKGIEKKCEHNFEYKAETVLIRDSFSSTCEAKRVVIFCKKCGEVSHDKVNGLSAYSQDLK